MARTAFIYIAALTIAECLFTGRPAQATDAIVGATGVVFETMKPVTADGKNKAPKIMDFTKDPEADKPKTQTKKLAGN